MSTLAQEESHTKSEIMNSSIEMRFRRGIFLTPPLLGYDQDENGDLVINPHEAKIVQLIFYMYLNGSSTQQIADSLTELGCKTKKNNDVWSSSTILQILQNERHCGDVLARKTWTPQQIADSLTELGCKTKKNNDVWSSSTILQILQNERHCGDVLARKTWTPNYLDHKSRKNNQDRNQYRKVGHHEAIISRDDFIAVQKLITNAKYGNKEILPELHVIQEGSLSGFISINPRWSGFKARDYFEASQSVLKPANMNVPDTITASAGSFDLRDYEVARGQFFSSVGRISVSFSYKQISFNKDAIRKFPNIKFVELLIHPSSKLLAIRPCSSETKNKVQWSRLKDGQLIPKPISGAAFLPTLYEIFKWDKKCKYRILGVAHQKDNENVLIFNMDDTEIRIPTSTNDVSTPNNNMPDTISDSKSVLAYPADWMNSFGNNYYTQSQAPELTEFTADKNWQTASESKPYKEPELQTTPKETIIQNIKNIITEIKGDTQ